MNCTCEDWKKADKEVFFIDTPSGIDLPVMKFCPWCGKPLNSTPDKSSAVQFDPSKPVKYRAFDWPVKIAYATKQEIVSETDKGYLRIHDTRGQCVPPDSLFDLVNVPEENNEV